METVTAIGYVAVLAMYCVWSVKSTARHAMNCMVRLVNDDDDDDDNSIVEYDSIEDMLKARE